ncbi:MAG: flavin monoamine oxidase family protein [Xanthobacteraceae bacterium]
MPSLSRRSLLAASAALAARPAFAAITPSGGPLDVIIIGAGAAGIAAARRLAAAGRRYLVIEATDHVGGRCITDTTSFGVPFDRGAHWIYLPDSNPLIKVAPRRGDIYPASLSQKIRIGRRYARAGELEDYLAAQFRAARAIGDAGRKADSAAAQAMPADLGDWRPTIEFVLGPYNSGKDLAQVSSSDFAKAAERRSAAFHKPGFGALLAALAQGLAIQLSTPALSIETRRGVAVETSGGTIAATAAIVTVPTNVIASGAFKLSPDRRDLFARLPLGSYDRIVLELLGNPLGLEGDDLVFEKSSNNHTAAILANAGGTPLCFIDVAGAFGRELSAQGEAAMFDFAVEWLGGLYGSEIKRAIGRKQATRWNAAPYALGAWSAALPGAQSVRRALMDRIADDIWYAGEAAHESLWGTVGGAWESGERAADAVLRRLGGVKAAAPAAETEVKPRRKGKPAQIEHRAPREEAAPRDSYGTPRIMRER